MNFQRLESYRKAARQACRYYGQGKAWNISLLHLSENITFLLTEDSDSTVRAVMRVSRTGYHSRAEIDGEMRWLEHLRRSDTVRTVRPIANDQGNLLTEAKGEDETYLCIVFEYLRGNVLSPGQDGSTEEDFREIGRIAAWLHRDTMEWKESGRLIRPHWDYENMMGVHGLFGDWRECRGLNSQEFDMVDWACQRIKGRLESYGKNDQNYGLIHGDLRAANLLKEGSVIQVMDFDDCGFGWHLYDLAASMSFIEDDRRLGSWVRAWLKGYETVIPLGKKDLQEIPTFIMARRIQLLAWLTSHEDSDPVKELYPGFAGKTVSLAIEYEKYISGLSE